MVLAEITSTLAGVCSRVRPSRLPAVLAPVRLSVGAANTGPAGLVVGARVSAVAAFRCWRGRARRVASLRRALRAFGGFADGSTTTGSSVCAGLADCAQPLLDTTRQENATERSNAQRCRGAEILREVINSLAITWHVTANAAWPLPQEEGSSTLIRTPRPMCSRVTTTDGRSPGSRVVACRRLPRPAGPVAFDEGSPLTVAGAATALGDTRTVFPIDLPKENRRRQPSFICKGLSTGHRANWQPPGGGVSPLGPNQVWPFATSAAIA